MMARRWVLSAALAAALVVTDAARSAQPVYFPDDPLPLDPETRDASAVRLHVWDVQDEAAYIAHYKSTYEAPLLEIYP